MGWGNKFPDLKNDPSYLDPRLTAAEQSLAQKASQSDLIKYGQNDYVEILKRYANFTKMQLKKIDTVNSIEVSVLNDTRHITFSFLNLSGTGDSYITQSYVYTGGYTNYLQDNFTTKYTDMTTTGSWAGGTPTVVAYTYVANSTFQVNVTVQNDGDSIAIHGYKTNNGGLWQITLNGQQQINYSCYATSGATVETELYSNLKAGVYTIKGTFVGQDPANPVASPNGYLNNSNDPTIVSATKFANVSKDYTLNTPSNKDWAFYIKPQGGTNYHFVPYHDVATAFEAEPKVYKDGDTVIDLNSLANQQFKSIKSFCLTSHMYGQNPDSGSTNLLEIWCNQTINLNGMYQVDGKMKVLSPVTIAGSYVIMGVANGIFNKLVSSIGTAYTLNTSMSNYALATERDYAKSYCFLSSSQPNLAIGYRFNNIAETLRQGQSGKDSDPAAMTYVNYLAGDMYKIYSRLWNTADLQTGYTLRFSGDYIYSVVDNIHNLLALT